ncbi:MAG: VOC family protein [Desulfotomaculaceae bacterium]|nr:VOC family protein [Desulfotomaculaceae bacterium]
MKFRSTTLKVKKLEDSLRFYQEIVGLVVDRRYVDRPGVEIAFLGDGETKIELICMEDYKDINIGKDISLGFEVNSVDEKIKFIQDKGLSIYSGPFQVNPELKYFYMMDPDGLKIMFVETM